MKSAAGTRASDGTAPAQPLVVVDVCGTLVHDDTTMGLLRFHLAGVQSKRWRFARYRFLTSLPVRSVFVLLEKVTSRHLLKGCLLRLLAGDNPADLEASAASYARLLLSQRRVLPVWDLLAEPLAAGRVLLASASIEPVVAALARELGVPYLASALEVREGTLTGRLSRDLTGRKLSAVRDLLGNEFEQQGFSAVSDNLSDRSLLLSSKNPTIVLHKRRHLRRWGSMPANFIDARS